MRLLHSFITLSFASLSVSALGLSDDTVAKVKDKMLNIIHYSWENGTATEALLELDEPDVSVYGKKPFPPPRVLSADSPVIKIAQYALAGRVPGKKPIMDGDGASGDPASMGVAVLLANSTLQDPTYFRAAADQLDFLLNDVPRAPNGAISHRESEVQPWNDFVYMAPPFISYYGALTGNITLVKEGKRQIGLYREILKDTNGTCLWHHVMMGSWQDPSFWGTGMAWVAAGATRTLQTMAKSQFAFQLIPDMWELAGWTGELINAAWQYQKPDGSLPNHANLPDDFSDAAWTALLASATYRLAVQTGNEQWIHNAEKAFKWVETQIADDGTLKSVVNPLSWWELGAQSPEGQAFVLLLQAAYRDFCKYKQTWAAPTLLRDRKSVV